MLRTLSTRLVPRAPALGQRCLERHVASAASVRTNRFKASILNAERQIGLWSMLNSSLVTEMLAFTSKLDWFVIDMEHTHTSPADVLVQLQSSQRGHAEPMVRVPWNEPVIVKRVLDLGAQSILFPYVQTAEEASAAVAATRYPPDGVRGAVSLQRMNGFGAQNPHYYREAAGQICVVVQIETIEGLRNIPQIGAVEGVDALFIGPSDLAASLGHVGNPGHPEVRAAIEEGFALIRETGKPGGFLSANPDDVKWVLEMGATFVAVGSDVALLSNLTRKLADDYGAFCATLPPHKL